MDTGLLQCLLIMLASSLLLPGAMEAKHDYKDALSKSILFYEGQRSGKLPANQRMNWRKDSALADGSDANVDLVGGYYDAGDNVKFGFPMAFTTTMLSWSVQEFGRNMDDDDLENTKIAIRWATDYLLKATAYPDTIFVQVGDPSADHHCWQRPEDMSTPRTVYKITKDNPGSEVAAETAAALAAASIVFKKSDVQYSNLLLQRAIQVFEFADKYRGAYSDNPIVRAGVCPFYCNYNGYEDELLWGAAWLHRATGKRAYSNYVIRNAIPLGASETTFEFGWDNKRAGLNVFLAKAYLMGNVSALHNYKSYADEFVCIIMPESPSSLKVHTPAGLIHGRGGGNMQRVTAFSFLLLAYANYLSSSSQVVTCGTVPISPARLRQAAKRQVDYILGDNPLNLSYMVGYGPRFPQRIHHRGASLESITKFPSHIACHSGSKLFAENKPNPNLLVGAIVGGPDENDQYKDDRADSNQSEPCTYYNAPLVGALAFFSGYPEI